MGNFVEWTCHHSISSSTSSAAFIKVSTCSIGLIICTWSCALTSLPLQEELVFRIHTSRGSYLYGWLCSCELQILERHIWLIPLSGSFPKLSMFPADSSFPGLTTQRSESPALHGRRHLEHSGNVQTRFQRQASSSLEIFF